MNYKFYLAIIIALFSLQSFAQIGVSAVANLNLQNTLQSTSQLSYFGNTDFRVSPTISLCINRPQSLHLINLSAQSSNVRIMDSGYFHSQFLTFGYSRLKPKNVFGSQISVGFGLDISATFSQTRSTFVTRKIIEEGGFGEVIKFTPYIQSRIPLSASNSRFQSILDLKAGLDLFGISNGNGVYNPMYFCSIGFGFYKNIKNK
jgi:hypothetical protein